MRLSSLLSVPLSASALLLSAALAAPLFASPARADDAVAADDDDFFKSDDKPKPPDVPDASAFNAGDDDAISIAAPIKVEPPPPKAAPTGPSRLGLDLNGKSPLTDNWAPAVVFTTADSVVVELPVLYANNGTGFDGNAYWLVAEVYADGKKLGEQRTQVMKETVSAKGPSVQFFRFFTPVTEASGVVELKVSKLASGSTKPSLLFTRSVSYSL
jgi:hypothetical protein